MKPIILTPTSQNNDGNTAQLTMNRKYTDAIERAGGVILACARPKDESLDEVIAIADGLLLMGGHDIDPGYYAEDNHECRCVDTERDALEFALLKRATAKGIPVFGICRGLQVMNVYFGGSLFQDVEKDLSGALPHDFHFINGEVAPRDHTAHEIRILKDSVLYHSMGELSKVNSLHHQGIKELAQGFRATAWTDDGLIEAIEHESFPFCVGVQWHPEELGDKGSHNLFDEFVTLCSKNITREISANIQEFSVPTALISSVDIV